jgi:hypothetical protein
LSDSGSDPSDRHQRLLVVALGALVAEHAGPSFSDARPEPTAFGAVVRSGLSQRPTAWVLLNTRDREPESLLGAVMAWALRAEVAQLHIVTDVPSATLARRAAHFVVEVSIWVRDGRTLSLLRPEPLGVPSEPDPQHLQFVDLISEAGATVTVEHGVVAGEVRGLEVCRVVDDASGNSRLEVGVGANDRLAFSMLYEGEPVEVSLRRVVSEVTTHRSIGAVRHPLNQLAKERFLRWHLEQSPHLLGLEYLAPVAGPSARRGLSFATPCTGIGRDLAGRPTLVVCSVGIDLDLVPYAIDARLKETGITSSLVDDGHDDGHDDGGVHLAPSRLMLVVPSRDLVSIQTELAALIAPDPQWDAAELLGLEWPSA